MNQIHEFLSMAGSAYVVPLFGFFWLADLIWYRQFAIKFLFIRLATMAIAVVTARMAGKQNDLRRTQIWASIFIFSLCLSLNAMLFIIGDPNSPYIYGLSLVSVGVSLGLRLTWGCYILNEALIIGSAFAFGIISGARFSVGSNFYLNIYFIASLFLISAVGRYYLDCLYIKELKASEDLRVEVANREAIIRKKTEESVRLHSLSKQFSPQIVEGMKSGKISLDARAHRAELCAIFVDIKDSTQKFLNIDRDDLQKVLSMYMEDVMGTFLRFDITIDKFLGDGVLGFANDPIPQSDYLERAVNAALEVLTRISSKAEVYESYWLSKFEVRIGIASGYASVGFYGSDLHVKSYTAIGRVMNLANRINGVADPNGISVSQDVISKLEEKNPKFVESLELRSIGSPPLKGFESEKIRIFAITPRLVSENLRTTGEDDLCPHGHGVLFLSTDDKGIYVLKCRQCSYVSGDETIKNSAVKKLAA